MKNEVPKLKETDIGTSQIGIYWHSPTIKLGKGTV